MIRAVNRSLAVLTLLCSAAIARAEYAEVTLKDGRTYAGEVV